jgi:DNA modification methylase
MNRFGVGEPVTFELAYERISYAMDRFVYAQSGSEKRTWIQLMDTSLGQVIATFEERYDIEQGWVTSEQWINWARPVWYAADYQPGTWTEHSTGESCLHGIRETDVLNVRQARETNDERHLCPLQLGVIERIVKVWSAPDEVVFDPFNGIGSTGYVALKNNRKYVGCELKQSYYESSIRNLNSAISERGAVTLFDLIEQDATVAA